MDETMVETSAKAVKVIVPNDFKYPAKKIPKERGMHITVVLCVCADGTHVTPTFILPLNHFPQDCSSICHRFHWAGQPEGWMTEEIYREWVIKVFIPHVNMRRQVTNFPEHPVLLWVDGHSSRCSPG